MGEKKAWYLGAMFKAGQFNYKLSGTGKQGNLMGGGITAGYQLRLNKALDLDFNLGLGYLNADYEKYASKRADSSVQPYGQKPSDDREKPDTEISGQTSE